MNEPAITVAARDGLLGREDNLRIAKREETALNAVVDLPRSQTNRQKLPAGAGGIAP